jgi:DNA-binding response OmpR family regulator
MRVLIIEDEARIAEILRTALRRAGFVVDAVALCADARAAFATIPYDVAILDQGYRMAMALACLVSCAPVTIGCLFSS